MERATAMLRDANDHPQLLARILLVEDDPHDVVLILAAFGEVGLREQVFVVHDGVQALDYLQARKAFRDRSPGYPAVVLLDVKLPLVDGFEVLQQILRGPGYQVAARGGIDFLESGARPSAGLHFGHNGYVVKSIDFEADTAALHAIAQYWAVSNEPPPGSLPRPKPASME